MTHSIYKFIILSLITIIVLLVIPDFEGVFVVKVAFVIFIVFIAGFIFSNEEAKQERVNKVNERTNEDESCNKYTNHKDFVYYNGHIISATKVYIHTAMNSDHTPIYVRIDKIYMN